MRRFPAFLALALGVAATPAPAQIQPEVTVNPNASGTRVLLYPGGQYGRVQKDLLQPGEPDPNAPIVLHMPRKHPVRRVAAKPAAPAKPKAEVAAAPQPPPKQQQTMSFSSIPKESAASLLMQEASKPAAKPKPAPPPKGVAAKPPPPKPQPQPQDMASFDYLSGSKPVQSAPPPPTRTASIDTSAPGRHSILFAPGAEEPPVSVVETIRGLSAGLNAALSSGTAQIRIEAFGGKQNDKSSDARRLSLKRALIIRQLLIDDGIPSERIVVQAMGGAASGQLDRVDIFVAA